MFLSHLFQPPLNSLKLEDIINYIQSDIVILKIDVEGYECKVSCVSYAQSASDLCPGSSARNNSQQSGEIPSLHLHGVGAAPKQQADVWKLYPVGPELLPRRIQTSKPRKVWPGIDQLVMTVSAAVLGH